MASDNDFYESAKHYVSYDSYESKEEKKKQQISQLKMIWKMLK